MQNISNKEQVVNSLLDYFQEFSLKDKIEIVAQLMIKWGVSHIFREHPELMPENTLTPEETIEIILLDKRKGESLGGALAHQGLIMLMWLTGEPNAKQRNTTIS